MRILHQNGTTYSKFEIEMGVHRAGFGLEPALNPGDGRLDNRKNGSDPAADGGYRPSTHAFPGRRCARFRRFNGSEWLRPNPARGPRGARGRGVG